MISCDDAVEQYKSFWENSGKVLYKIINDKVEETSNKGLSSFKIFIGVEDIAVDSLNSEFIRSYLPNVKGYKVYEEADVIIYKDRCSVFCYESDTFLSNMEKHNKALGIIFTISLF